MFRKYNKSILFSIILFSLVLPLMTPQIKYEDGMKNMKLNTEKRAEVQYIRQDALLTTKINLQNMLKQLQISLVTIDNINDVKNLKREFPEVVSITPYKQGRLSLKHIINAKEKQVGLSPFYTTKDGEFVDAVVSILNNKMSITYYIKIKLNLLSQIEKKQQLRMFTVTHLQNDRWKTNPTKYRQKKKLSLNLNDSLPNLNPEIEEKGISHYIRNEVIIKFKKGVSKEQIEEIISKYNIKIEKRIDKTILVSCKERSTESLIKLFEDEDGEASPLIEYIEPHFIYLTNEVDKKAGAYSIPLIPNDSLYLDYQWNLPIIFTEQGWEITKGRENVIVAVIDTGVDLNHPEFEGKLVDGINILDTSKLPLDDDGHGTHVAGIISANTNNREGIAGITWYNKIMPIKVLDQSGAGTLFDVAEGIIWAADHGAKVINLSLGNYAESKFLHEAVKYAYSKDVVLIAATGNDNTNDLGYPAAYPEVIGVSAIDNFRKRAEFSNYGDYVDVVAPGVNVPSTFPDKQYAALSGTSMASPHVAGLAGLIRSINPDLSNKEVNEIIKITARDLGTAGKDQYYGYGQINIVKAINYSTQEREHRAPFISRLIKFFTQRF